MFTLSNLPSLGHKKTQRVGRGNGSHRGKNAGKGHKGQTKHGGRVPIGFEGGQRTLMKRTPKFRGFSLRQDNQKAEITLVSINAAFSDGEVVSIASLLEKGLISPTVKKVRVIASGKLEKKVSFADEEGIYLTKGVQAITA